MKVPPYRPSLLFDELGLEPYHICLEEKDAGELDEAFYKIHDELRRSETGRYTNWTRKLRSGLPFKSRYRDIKEILPGTLLKRFKI